MANDILVLGEHAEGALADTTFELLGKAKELAGSTGGRAVVALFGASDLVGQLGAADAVVTVDDPALANYTAEGWERALKAVVDQVQPRLVLIANTTVGLDLAGALSATWDAPLAAYVGDVAFEGDTVVVTAQVYGGKLLAEAELAGDKGVVAVLAGAFAAEPGRADGSPATESVTVSTSDMKTNFLSLIKPEAGDVDITAAEFLVSVGRGIGSQDNLELVQEVADALGAPLASSRPITDQGWLPKTRQVGKSGLKVKPKAYLTFGISGAPEHLEGMRDAELIIACNTDEAAPIFDIAHYGTTADLFDLLPALSERLGG
ncbi:MAG TPA: electron transfer flavoprotein subunit alpha/FixB family protein [Acidimicrobiia bacterium]|nr:electron transfer flavoprotein subunit alpha/FixB family protein [Acidimicrobiia bacterium]